MKIKIITVQKAISWTYNTLFHKNTSIEVLRMENIVLNAINVKKK